MTDAKSMNDSLLTPEYVRKKLEICLQDDGGKKQTYRDATGETTSTVYQVFPGVSLFYKDVHRKHFISNWRHKSGRKLVIEYCWQGQMKCQMGEDCLSHMAGDVMVFCTDYTVRELFYPIGYFQSVAISINLDEVSPTLITLLDRISTSLDLLMKKYQLDQHRFFVVKKNTQLENIFKEIYDAPESVKGVYWGVKVFEILLLLAASIQNGEKCPKQHISQAQKAVAKEAHRYLVEHKYERITIDELAKIMSVSPTQLKTGFKAVYGISIKRFDREQKMKEAAQLLESTNRQVSDIACQFGYINTSKFSSAFQSIIGKTPLEYRASKQLK